jgi:hypothetical protein
MLFFNALELHQYLIVFYLLLRRVITKAEKYSAIKTFSR